MSQIQVTKRDNRKESLDLEKLHKVVFWATENINGVSASQVEIKSHISFLNVYSKTDIPSANANPCSYTKSVYELISILKLGLFNAGYIPVGMGIILPGSNFTGELIQARK